MQNKIFLVIFQIWFLYFWNIIIRFLDSIKLMSILLLVFFSLIYFQLWPQTDNLKSIIIYIFITSILVTFIEIIKTLNKIKWPSIFRIKLMLENKLNLLNNEILNIFDVPAENIQARKSPVQQNIWKNSKKRSIQIIEKKKLTTLKNFFLSDFKISNFTKLSVLIWILIGFSLNDGYFYKNLNKSLSTNQVDILKINSSTNIWIFPPKGSKNETIFLEKSFNDKTVIKTNFLIEDKSTIMFNVFNTKPKDVKLLIKTKNNKYLKKDFTIVDFDKLKYEELLSEGEYTLLINNTIFQKLVIKKDKAPKVKFTSNPEYKKGLLNFEYEIFDENNLRSWIEISRDKKLLNKIQLEKVKNFGQTFAKPNHSYLLDNANDKRKKEFKKKIENIIFDEKEYFLTIKSLDNNNNQSTSLVKKITLTPKEILDNEAMKIFKLRKNLYFEENIAEVLASLDKIGKQTKNDFLNQNISNLIKFIELSDLTIESKINTLMNKMWNILIFLEDNNIENIKKKILLLKEKLSKLLKENNNDLEISEKMNELQNLLAKFLELSNINSEEKESILSKLEEDIKKENVKNKENNLRAEANNLLEKIDSLLNEQDPARNEKILEKIQSVYELQKNVIDQTFKKDELLLEKNIFEQKNVEKKIRGLEDELIQYLPNLKKKFQGMILDSTKSEENMRSKDFESAIKNQRDILFEIKEIYKNLNKDNAQSNKSSKDIQEQNMSKAEDKKYEVPIVFEKNSLNELIEKIRDMTNEVQRKEEEKDYLKNLLPDY